MNLTKKTILAVGLLVAGASFAQTTQTTVADSAPAGGVLGQRFVEARVGLSDIEHFDRHQYDAGARINVPLTANLDLTGLYSYSRIRGLTHSNSLGAGLTAYTNFNGVKPFLAGGVGYDWLHFSGFDNEDDWYWVGAVGVEIPVGSALSVTPRVVFTDDFHGPSEISQINYEVEANYWLTSRMSVFASVGFIDVDGTVDDDFDDLGDPNVWDYSVGLRFKF